MLRFVISILVFFVIPKSLFAQSALPDRPPVTIAESLQRLLAVTDDVEDWFEQPAAPQTWFAQADTLFLQLTSHSANHLPLAGFDFDSYPEMRFSGSSYEDGRYRAVPKITIGHQGDDGVTCEVTWFGRDDWQRSANLIVPPSNLAGTLVSQQTSLATNFQSVEANLFLPAEPESSIKFVAGVRYFLVNQRLNLVETENSFTADSAVTNNLIGGQIGARYDRAWDRWSVNVNGKVGVFGNLATSREDSLIYGPEPITRTATTSAETDIAINLQYRVTQRCFAKIGYQFLWLDHVALAAGQLSGTGPLGSVAAKDSLMLQGPTAGLEIRF